MAALVDISWVSLDATASGAFIDVSWARLSTTPAVAGAHVDMSWAQLHASGQAQGQGMAIYVLQNNKWTPVTGNQVTTPGVTGGGGGGGGVYDANGVGLSGFAITPTTGDTGTSYVGTATLTTNTTVVFVDSCISVRDAATLLPDDSHLDFDHSGPLTLASTSESFTSSHTFPVADSYVAFVSYLIDSTWTHMPVQIDFTVSNPTVPPSGINPLGSIGFRSGLNRMSGMWPLDRSGSGTSYTTTQKLPESAPSAGRGRKVDVTMASQYNNGSWGDLTGQQILDFLDDYANTTGGPIPIVMLPPWIPGGSWAAAGAGTYDSDYQAIGAAIASKRGSQQTILRAAWEYNGDWYQWGVVNIGGTSAHMASTFIAGWQRMVSQIRIGAGVHASSILFDYCSSNLDDKSSPTVGSGSNTLNPLTVLYPGDLYVDCIGGDLYDDDGQVTTSYTVPGKKSIMDTIYAFAQAHSKLWSVPEWGLNHTSGSGKGGDNPLYIQAMIAYFTSHKDILLYESYFQDDDLGNVNSSLFSPDVNNNPNSKAAYLALMA